MRPSAMWGIDDPGSMILAIAFDSEVLQKANAYESRKIDEARSGATSDSAKKEKRAASYLMWKGIAETAPDDSERKRIATETMERLEREVVG